MKQFDEWWKNCRYKQQDLQNKCEYELIEIGFRAALEWIKHIVVHESDGPSNSKNLIQCIDKKLI